MRVMPPEERSDDAIMLTVNGENYQSHPGETVLDLVAARIGPPSPPALAPAPEPASQKTDTLINLDGSEEEGPEDPEPMPMPKPQGPPRAKVTNMNPELNRLLASGDGVDTFGNTGDMRLGPNAAMWHQAMQQQRTGQAGSNPFAK